MNYRMLGEFLCTDGTCFPQCSVETKYILYYYTSIEELCNVNEIVCNT